MASIPLKIVRIHNSQFKCNYLKNERIFLNFLFHFWNLHQILNALKETIILIGNVFSKLETVKILLIPLSKKRRFRTRFDSQHVKASHILARSPSEHFCHPFPSFSGKLIGKMSAIALGEVLVVFVKRLTADGKYPVQDCGSLQLPIQMQLRGKRKTFSEFFVKFLESTSNFKHFERKDDCYRSCISEIRDCENLPYTTL